ncbi:MAG: flagellar filament capping protein FliD [Deltaproteobacteria bacterium]|nr:flagellar filament capping protein FliD [Deltaproteobacteria bacterium]
MATSTNLIAGLSTGFDWRTMIDQLISIEHRRVDIIEDKKSTYESKLNEWQSFNSKLLSLKNAADRLKDPADFYLYTSTMVTDSTNVDGKDLLSVSTNEDASPGSYTVKVLNLAKAQKLSSNPFTSLSEELGSSCAGDIIINGKVIAIDSSDTLSHVANKINNANSGNSSTGVTASIVNYGANDYRLLLTSDDTGSEGISLLNGSSTDLVQKFGWKDSTAAILKNSITNGAQSDLFSTQSTAVKSLLGLQTGEISTGTLAIGGTAVTIDLATQSLNDIKNAVNDADIAGVTASIVSESIEGKTCFRLQIDGTQAFVDENNILNTLGILDHTSIDVTGRISTYSLTEEGSYITSSTLLKDIDGYNAFTSGGYPGGDYITLTGNDTSGANIGTVNFSISASTTIQDLLGQIESTYGDVTAYVSSDGKIRVDDLTGGSALSVSLTSTVQDINSQLVFGNFNNAASRKREIIAGENATLLIDGVEITNSSNTIEDVIEGVTLNLLNENDDATITLNVKRDIDEIKSNIEDFVKKYNEIISYIDSQFDYNEENGTTGGILFGDGTLRAIRSDLLSTLMESVWGLHTDFSALSLIGIENDLDEKYNSTLSINDSILSGYLQTNYNDVVALFVGQGSTSVNSLDYIGHGRNTNPGEYTVHIDRAATRGSETGNIDLSAGGADERLTVTQGNNSASITITSDMTLDDIKNAINYEFDTDYTQAIVGDSLLYSEDSQTIAITSETKWNSIYDSTGTKLTFDNGETISFSGTSRNGTPISGNYSIGNAASDTMQGLLSAIENAFSNNATASIDSSGRIVLTDKYDGYSQLTLSSVSHSEEGEFFGIIDITDGAGDGSQAGRYAIAVTATDDGNGHLVLRSDDYGSHDFTISQATTDNNYDQIIYAETANTTDSSDGTVYVTSGTVWNDISGASLAVNDKIDIAGYARDGSTPISATYTITSLSDTLDDLLTTIEGAYSAQGTSVDAFIKDGRIHVEDRTTGTSSIALTLTPVYDGGGNGLSLGTFDQTTKRDMDLGLINGDVAGLDVAGTIGGESSTGNGQVLRGDDGNVNTEGLSVRYTGNSNDSDAGEIKITIGVGDLINRKLFDITDSVDGYVSFKTESLQNSITDFTEHIASMEDRLNRRMEQMINRFVTMELAINRFQLQSQWLAGQIEAISNGWVYNN